MNCSPLWILRISNRAKASDAHNILINGTEKWNADNRHTQFNDLSPTAEVVRMVYDSVRSVSAQDHRAAVERWRTML